MEVDLKKNLHPKQISKRQKTQNNFSFNKCFLKVPPFSLCLLEYSQLKEITGALHVILKRIKNNC